MVPEAYLCERARIKLVLARNLESDIASSGRIPSCFGASLHLGVDHVIVAGRENAQIVCRGDCSGVGGCTISDSSSIFGNGGLLDVVATLDTSNKSFMSNGEVNICRLLEEVDEGACA